MPEIKDKMPVWMPSQNPPKKAILGISGASAKKDQPNGGSRGRKGRPFQPFVWSKWSNGNLYVPPGNPGNAPNGSNYGAQLSAPTVRPNIPVYIQSQGRGRPPGTFEEILAALGLGEPPPPTTGGGGYYGGGKYRGWRGGGGGGGSRYPAWAPQLALNSWNI